MIFKRTLLILFLIAFISVTARAQVDAKMFRQPDVSATHITFVYAGDIWVVPKDGGLAHRLSSPLGEESYPRFSPDGSRIAFSGNYDGNTDVYVIPTLGGNPVRISYHPFPDRVIDWLPSGQGILFVSSRESGRQRYDQFFSVSSKGGLPDKLSIAYGESGSFSPDEKYLTFTTTTEAFRRTWKRYRGGLAPDIWLFELQTNSARNLTNSDANDDYPMWHGETLYFLSDRGPNQRQNIWKYDMKTEKISQVTDFKDYDITVPAIGPKDIVFEAGGRLYLLDLETKKYREVDIDVVTDLATLKPRMVNLENFIQSAVISPSGKRAVFEARGDIFTVPAEHGYIRNLTQRSGSAERHPSWSPDGKHIAYWSDRSGEYELTICPADGTGKEKTLTQLGKGFRYQIFWSPDSKKISFIDYAHDIQIFDMETSQMTKVDNIDWLSHPSLSGFELSWSADSNWIAYTQVLENFQSVIMLYDVKAKKSHQVTSGYYSDHSPAFDPEGKYLYFFTERSLSPIYSPLDGTWIYPNTTRITAVSLRKDVPSPLAPRNDAEKVEEEKDKKEIPKEEQPKEEKPEKKEEEKKPEELKIDLEGFESRLVVLPPSAGNYSMLRAIKGQIIYHQRPRTGSDDRQSPILVYNLEKREEETILDDASGFEISADGKKMFVALRRSYYIIDIKPKQKLTQKLRTNELEMMIDPRAEWKQMFMDIWRNYRDFFYDPHMHGVDWEEVRSKYGTLLKDAVTRWDANFIFGDIIGELNASHTYVGGGDLEAGKQQNVGMLGIDWALENGAYRIAKIVDGAPWDNEVRSPFKLPGVNVNEGDYILAVNGIPLDKTKDPWAAFQGLAGKTVALTLNEKPTSEGAREVIVETLRNESRLRNLEWIESSRRRVKEASNGKVGYIYMPDTSINGQTELIRQYYAQIDKDGFIVDERFNSGGQLADRFIELLSRPRVHYIAWRHGKEIQQPTMANPAPKVMLINGWSGSGGDALPYTFRGQGVGPIVGMRTFGALIGPAIGHRTVDGGFYTVPEGRIYGNDGAWFAEGHGVDPDIEVIDDPSQLAKGVDPQLERAIEEVMRLLEADPPKKAGRPAYQNRTAKAKKK
ncbi:MAG: PDZ domain-containing protein [Candidatus Aminicenantes bacterium]|nr:PDZ domain-containing protein [Candidatus Aminicenantes bacterium]